MRTLSRSIHAMAFELRARDRRCHKLARSLAGAHAIKRLERQHGTQAQWITPKDTSHGVVHHEQRVRLTGRASQSTKIGYAQTEPAD